LNGNIEEGPMQKSPHQIAAEMLAGVDAWDQALNAELYDRISEAERLVRRGGGQLTSRQAIAAIIVAWQIQNPGVVAYG
jgi:hypothetical protein